MFRSIQSQALAKPADALWRRPALALVTVIALVVGTLTAAMPVTPAAAAAPVGVVTGTVTAAGGAPLQYMYVTLLNREGMRTAAESVYTDASGNYSIDVSSVAAGEYSIEFTDNQSRYATEYWNDSTTLDNASFFAVTSTASVAAKNATLAVGGTITGTITASDGAFGPSDQVGISLRLINVDTGRQMRSGYVSSFGAPYQLTGIAAGTYKLQFEPVHPNVVDRYVAQYWAGASTLASARSFTISAGETKTSFDAVLAPGARLSGRVTAEGTGAPLADVSVGLVDSAGRPAGFNEAVTDSNGYYTFDWMLPADSYTVKFSTSPYSLSSRNFVSEYWENARFESTSTPVKVTSAAAIVKDAQLAVGGSISGTVTLPEGADRLSAFSTAYAFDSVTKTWIPQNSAQTAEDGSYTIPGLAAGTYHVGFEAYSSGTSIGTRVYDGATGIESGFGVRVTAAGITTGIDGVIYNGVSRLAGADRFDASASISQRSFKPGVDVAYVANGLNFPDALSGAPVAAQAGAPILLTLAGEIPASIKAELERLRPGRIVVLGGINSVSEAVKTQLKSFTAGTVTRLAGADRFAASAAISAESFDAGVETVYVANGLNFPDALAGAPVAAKDGSPILLVTPSAVPAPIEAELKRLKPGRIVVLGGVNSVSEAVNSQLGQFTTSGVTRLAGADRFSASADISAKNFAPGAPVVYITSGSNFPDALSGAPVAGRDAAPILLVAPDSLPVSIADELTRLKPASIVILGGVNSVKPAVAEQLMRYTVVPPA
ncbi:carboxypeptidase family protein [Glaciihabitans tibetensis]|uniref:Carboxypeptidase family protein n=1 Tax=Glaciihabitans tibetensis TaxID=1266600 RepID=A0A2T0VFB8_9MICO|nr:cell wall-binding repeat-containing protein [Glaciihabitans tibetensis]PRY68885.1 carboxypeptidase family protein [Glaciihabitans tibetensis]